MPSGSENSKDEPTHEKLPTDHTTSETVTKTSVEGDGMDAHIETKSTSKETSSKDSKAKEEKTEDDSNSKTI